MIKAANSLMLMIGLVLVNLHYGINYSIKYKNTNNNDIRHNLSIFYCVSDRYKSNK